MGTRLGLDRDAVVAAAAQIADAEGIEAVTLARLAAALGIRSPSLYNHIAGQDGLRRELALRGLREMSRRLGRAAIGKARDDALLTLADAYRAFAREHPGLYIATQRATDASDVELSEASSEVVAIVLAVLGGYGLTDDDAIHAARGLRAFIHGFVSLETNGGFGLPLDLDESFRRLVRLFIAGLSAKPAPGTTIRQGEIL